MRRYCFWLVGFYLGMALLCGPTSAQRHKDLPPQGIQIDESVLAELSARVDRIDGEIESLAATTDDTDLWQPDLSVLTRAVRLAIEQNGFFKKSEVKDAGKLLDEARRRLGAVRTGKRGLDLIVSGPVTDDKPTLVVGGFRSRIDQSIQPYGLVIPIGYQSAGESHRLDVWLHGRGDTKTEIPFLTERMKKVGQCAPERTFVLHPFGRHCVAYKFAGETDVYEAIDHVASLVSIDRQRIAMRGFSMGGAGVWHLGVHDPANWFAVNPGAGFVDTVVYQGWTETVPFEMTPTRTKLLNWYDVLPWAENLANTNVVAYSGEVDKQRQAAERLVARLDELQIANDHIIGKGMGHKIDQASAVKIDEIVAAHDREGLSSPRKRIDFTTYLLRYHQADWLSVQGLEEQFRPGRVQAERDGDHSIAIATDGVTRLALDFSASAWPGDRSPVMIRIDGQVAQAIDQSDADGLQIELVRDDESGQWMVADPADKSLRKRPGLQGPIDDAFCESFVFVRPSRPAAHGVVQRWIDREIEYATDRWKTLMRGDVRIVDDVDVTDQMIASSNLVCFGDFASNRFLAKIAGGLPILWSRDELTIAGRRFDPATHAAVFCFPNPASPDRYVVVNSGMTFRQFSNVSNSRQIAMLPDWAILKVDAGDDAIFAGEVVADGFFDETWKVASDQTADD